ncbi:MAG: Phosphatidylglycerophosphatase A [Deltaproteobacteria bacterium ADurb.Bin510]|nr:MAG: Phosphatidylglycerophosphatase A [Deltaproteobacteria bacterium ADurb.Bin510]
MQSKPSMLIATFFGAGLVPVAPGTAGSLAALPFYCILRGLRLGPYLIATAALSLIGTVCAHRAEKILGEDPGAVVIDEVAGQLLALMARPADVKQVLAGFALFRLFDILKPGPVGWCDRQLKGGIGIMADDLVAGLLAAAALKPLVRVQR